MNGNLKTPAGTAQEVRAGGAAQDGPEAAGALGDALVAAPLHEQVKERILQRILLGEWPAGFVLPPEMELARQLGVSYGTVRRAMVDLTAQGVLMRRRRTGTVVTGRSPHHTLDRFYHYYRLHSSDGDLVNTESRVLKVEEREARQEDIARLLLEPGARVGFVLRLRIWEGRPVMIDRVVIPLARIGRLPRTADAMPSLIFKWLLEEHGHRLSAVRERVTARLASLDDCALLDLDPGQPHALLNIDEVAFDATNTPLLTMSHAALTDAHCYVNEMR